MDIFRKYGKEPFSVVIVHGGPGAPGYMKPVAEELSEVYGVIEPLQSGDTIDRQLDELKEIIKNNCTLPVTLIGHSYGAWLITIFASEYPEFIKNIILVSSGPFDAEYVYRINETINKRLQGEDLIELKRLREELNNPEQINKKEIFKRFGKLSSKADYYKRISDVDYVLDYQPDIFQTVMREVLYMRKSGKLLKIAGRLKCPVLAIHGDFDPHPYEGVEKSLKGVVSDFRFTLLKNCGHYPWNEVYAKEEFYKTLKNEL